MSCERVSRGSATRNGGRAAYGSRFCTEGGIQSEQAISKPWKQLKPWTSGAAEATLRTPGECRSWGWPADSPQFHCRSAAFCGDVYVAIFASLHLPTVSRAMASLPRAARLVLLHTSSPKPSSILLLLHHSDTVLVALPTSLLSRSVARSLSLSRSFSLLSPARALSLFLPPSLPLVSQLSSP